jgi:SAM-dependent methyltransferase
MIETPDARVCPLLERRTATQLTSYCSGLWRVVQCVESGFVFLENPPAYTALQEDYAWEKTVTEERARRRRQEPVFSTISGWLKRVRVAIQRRKRLERAIERSLAGRRGDLAVCDVGCADGSVLARVAQRMNAGRLATGSAIRPYGVEVSLQLHAAAHAAFTPQGGCCVQGDAASGLATYPDSQFDLIIMSSFLEHEVQPLPLLRLCRTKLKPDGQLLIKVPNYDSLNRRVRQARWCGFRYPDHVNYFTPRTLRAMVERAGLRVVRFRWADRLPTSDNMWLVAGV